MSLLYKSLPSSVIANIIIASVVFFVLSRLIDISILTLWFCVVLSINIGRYILYKSYIRNKKAIKDTSFWDKYFFFFLVLSALSWSAVSVWLLPDSNSIYHYFPVIILIGISAGAVSALSFSIKNIVSYLILLLLPLFIVEISIGTFISNSVAGLIFLLVVLSFVSAKRINNTVVENITLHYESKKYTDNLIESRNEAIAANSAKTNFISMISHELRTPLNAILGFSQLLKMSDEPELNKEQDEQVNGIVDSGKHLLSLIEELLDLAKIEAHKLNVSIEEVSLTYILAESISLLAPVAATFNIKVNNVDNKNLNLVKGDAKRLKQIFINLISNAIKYNNEKGMVTIKVVAALNNMIRVSVSDTGRGLTQQQQNDLFTPFQRFDNKREGIGLGLFITHNLIKLMHGEIGVESKIDKGSTFWIELPAANEIIMKKAGA